MVQPESTVEEIYQAAGEIMGKKKEGTTVYIQNGEILDHNNHANIQEGDTLKATELSEVTLNYKGSTKRATLTRGRTHVMEMAQEMVPERSATDKVVLTKADNGEPIEDEIKNLQPGTVINVTLQSESKARYDLITSDAEGTTQEGPEGPLEGTSQTAGPGEVCEALQQAKTIRRATEMWRQANGGETTRTAPDPFLMVTTDDYEQIKKKGCLQVLGSYTLYPSENKRPCYTKTDGDQMTIYYWQGDAKEADEDMTGWWIGQEPGGERVYARSISNTAEPPTDEWSAPWDQPPQIGIIKIMKHKTKPYDKEKDDEARKRAREKRKN